MAIIITSPVTGSLKINNSSASPQISYLCNNETVNVQGSISLGNQIVTIANSNQQVITTFKLPSISTIAASTPVGGFTLQQAVTEIANLIMK